jgi:hypothetical protein
MSTSSFSMSPKETAYPVMKRSFILNRPKANKTGGDMSAQTSPRILGYLMETPGSSAIHAIGVVSVYSSADLAVLFKPDEVYIYEGQGEAFKVLFDAFCNKESLGLNWSKISADFPDTPNNTKYCLKVPFNDPWVTQNIKGKLSPTEYMKLQNPQFEHDPNLVIALKKLQALQSLGPWSW